MPDEPGNDTCAGEPQLLHLAVCLHEPGSSPDFPSSSFMLACWICAAVSPTHLLTFSPQHEVQDAVKVSLCCSSFWYSVEHPGLNPAHISAVDISASCHSTCWIMDHITWILFSLDNGFIHNDL